MTVESNCLIAIATLSDWLKVTANLFGLEFCKILKSYHKIAHYIYFVLKKKLFENVCFLRSYSKFCVLPDLNVNSPRSYEMSTLANTLDIPCSLAREYISGYSLYRVLSSPFICSRCG